jgi:hypothetical protein
MPSGVPMDSPTGMFIADANASPARGSPRVS